MTLRQVSLTYIALSGAAVLSACGTSPPPRTPYVLGSPIPERPKQFSEFGEPVVEVTLALVPDYLDTTDIIIRHPDDSVVASQTGRWAERLSLGITDAVTKYLAERLPNVVVTAAPSTSAPWRQVLIDVGAFEVQPNGTCVMAAQWSVRAGRGGRLLGRQRITLVLPIPTTDDPAVVAAMSQELKTLAGSIATSLQPGGVALQ